MLLKLLTIWVMTSLSLGAQLDQDACALVNEPMYCTCDEFSKNSAHTASCSMSGRASPKDLFWTGFKNQQEIRELILRSREETKLDFVPSFVLKGLHHLSKFVMRDCNVDTLWGDTFVNMSSLETIYLERNEIQVLERGAFSFLPELTELSMEENRIRKMPAGALFRLPKLQKLHLSKNNMTTIEDLAFVELPNLMELDLSSNNLHLLTDRTFVGLRSLKKLYLSRNKLTFLNDGVFSGATALTELDLWSNQIEHLNIHALDGLNQLANLGLSNNHIKHLQDNIFKGAPALVRIELNQNKLQTFQQALVAPLHIEKKENFYVNIRGNHLNCSCDLLWLTSLVETAKSHMFRKELHHLKCRYSSPHHQESTEPDQHPTQHISKLTAEEFNCPVVKTSTTQQPTTRKTSAVKKPNPSHHSSDDRQEPKEANEPYPYSNDEQDKNFADVSTKSRKPLVQASTRNDAFSVRPSIYLGFLLAILVF